MNKIIKGKCNSCKNYYLCEECYQKNSKQKFHNHSRQLIEKKQNEIDINKIKKNQNKLNDENINNKDNKKKETQNINDKNIKKEEEEEEDWEYDEDEK